MFALLLVPGGNTAVIIKKCDGGNCALARVVPQQHFLNRRIQGKHLCITGIHPKGFELAPRSSPPRIVCEAVDGGKDGESLCRFIVKPLINLDLVELCRRFRTAGYGLRIDAIDRGIAPLSRGIEGACALIDAFEPRRAQLVLEFTGRKLQCFNSSRELCSAVCDALEGHSELRRRTEVVHGDINSNNILITKEGKGLLVDGDLSKPVDSIQKAARQSWKTGTWSFMSRASLVKLDKPNELSDDLEAFFHVLLYHVLRYRTASKQLRLFQGRMHEIFDQSFQGEKGYFHGGNGKFLFFRMDFFDANEFAAILPAPLAGLIEELRDIFNVFYWPKIRRRAGPSPEVREEARERLRSSEYCLDLFKVHLNLDGWVHDGPAVDVLSQLPQRNKRRWRM